MLIVETRRVLARWASVERRLFEVTGGWVPTTGDHEVARWLATVSHHHAWRASLWSSRQPVLHDVDAPPDDAAWEALLAAVAAPHDPACRLTGLELAIGALLEEYQDAWSAAAEVCDGPLVRGLQLAVPDATEDRRSAVALLDSAPEGEQVADHRSSLEALRGALGR